MRLIIDETYDSGSLCSVVDHNDIVWWNIFLIRLVFISYFSLSHVANMCCITKMRVDAK